ncbi:MAG: M23 family metallopeptidase [Bacteroidota bacterium]
MVKKTDKNKLKRKLTHNYRLVISSEDTWEEKFSLRLNRLNVFVSFGLILIFLMTSTILLIAFSPLREYIPGYNSTELRRNAQNLVFKTDSLENIIKQNQLYIDNLALILSGEIDSIDIESRMTKNLDSINNKSNESINVDFGVPKEDSIFRSELEMEDRYNIFGEENKSDFVLVAPISGNLTQVYDSKNKHYAIDVAVEEGTPVKAVADGTIIFSEWTSTTGNVIILEHENNLISVYKHCASTTKEQGDFVESGEVIASSGSTGEFSTGPHLHFELWYSGYPVNPSDYIDFEL